MSIVCVLQNEWFYELITEAGYELRSYSGRGMQGKVCLGVELDQFQNQLEFAADLIETLDDRAMPGELAENLRHAKWDSLGLGTIVYFPSIPWINDYDPDDEREDDYSEDVDESDEES